MRSNSLALISWCKKYNEKDHWCPAWKHAGLTFYFSLHFLLDIVIFTLLIKLHKKLTFWRIPKAFCNQFVLRLKQFLIKLFARTNFLLKICSRGQKTFCFAHAKRINIIKVYQCRFFYWKIRSGATIFFCIQRSRIPKIIKSEAIMFSRIRLSRILEN